METLFSSVQSLVSYAVPMVILLGLLIFVHELGHFLVAKFFKVRVEVFSLGFGPKLLKFKRGDTVYAISAIPLGGYVKMFGDDPTAEIGAEHKAYAFTSKPVGQRIAVVLAGPLMNFFFAILLFAGVASLGEQTLAPQLGDIEPATPAYAAGFRSGDAVTAVDGRQVKTWDDMQKIVEENGDQHVAVEVQRANGRETVQVTPKLTANKNVMSWDRHVGEVEGLTYASRAAFVGVKDPKSIVGLAGLRTGDSITRVNDTPVNKWRDFISELSKVKPGETLKLGVDRGLLDEKTHDHPEKISVSVTAPDVPKAAKGSVSDTLLTRLGIEFPELYLAGIEPGSPASQAGLKVGDRLITVDGQRIASFEQVATVIRSAGNRQPNSEAAPALSLTVLRDGVETPITVSPNMKKRMSPQGREERRFEIGIRPLIVDATPSMIDLRFNGPIETVSRGFSQTVKWTSLTVLSFVRLFQAEVSPKNIGGFLSIGQMAKKSWQIGPSQFLSIMAIISINLFILNLLPVPVLDGGHLVFYTIEAIKGAPLSMRKMEIAQQVGLVLLLGLMVFALFNDVTGLIN